MNLYPRLRERVPQSLCEQGAQELNDWVSRMTQSTEAIKILLVDDHTLFCEALRTTLEIEDDFTVVAQAQSGTLAMQLVGEIRPDVVLMDAMMPGDSVTTRVSRIREASPATRVIILTMHDDPVLVQDLLQLGIRGYLLKSATRLELVAAIRAVHADEQRVVLSVSPASLTGTTRMSGERERLSDREREVLLLVAQGLSNSQIATQLTIAEGTVKRHLRNTFTKLDAVSRIDAVNKALAASLIAAPQSRGITRDLGRRNGRP
jgi:DNA-binding NarL/FixJ family response regulator